MIKQKTKRMSFLFLPRIPGLNRGQVKDDISVDDVGPFEEDDSGSENSSTKSDDPASKRKNSSKSSGNTFGDDPNAEQGLEPDLFIEEKAFCAFSAFLGTLNLFVMGTELDVRCHRGNYCTDDESMWDYATHALTALFVLEMIVRIANAKPRRFVMGDQELKRIRIHKLNCFDFLLVFLRVLDCWLLAPVGVQSDLRLISVFRIIRLGPAVRHYQTNPSVRELWLVVGAVSQTIQSLFWVGVGLVMVIFVCAVLVSMSLLHATGEEFNFSRASWSYKDYWGSVPKTSYSLFQVVTRDRWSSSMIYPLVEHDPMIFLIFGCFASIGMLALLNTIVGVVVESTVAAASQNANREDEERKRDEALVLDSLEQIFIDADVDKSESLDIDELHALFPKYEVRDRLKLLRIPLQDLDLLFTLLDVDGKGKVPTDMFFRGCAKLRGQARASDLNQLNIDFTHNIERCQEHTKQLQKINEVLATVVDEVDDMDLDIMKDKVSDDKDPIVKCRQNRPKVSKADVIRGRWLVPMAQNEQNMWMDLDRLSSKGSGAGSRNISKAQDGKVVVIASARKGAHRDKADEKRKRAQAAKKDAPAPPPMPSHLQHLDNFALKAKQSNENKVTKGNRRRVHDFD